MHQPTPMNEKTENLVKAKIATLDAWDTLTAVQNAHGFISKEWDTLHQAKVILLARTQHLSNLIEAENAKEGDEMTRPSNLWRGEAG